MESLNKNIKPQQTKVIISKSFYSKGKLNNIQCYLLVGDLDKYFDKKVSDAVLFAKVLNGSIDVQRTNTSLYINYLDIPNTTLIDSLTTTI